MPSQPQPQQSQKTVAGQNVMTTLYTSVSSDQVYMYEVTVAAMPPALQSAVAGNETATYDNAVSGFMNSASVSNYSKNSGTFQGVPSESASGKASDGSGTVDMTVFYKENDLFVVMVGSNGPNPDSKFAAFTATFRFTS